MNLGFFLLPVLAGYWFLTRVYYTRSGVLRDSGYHLFFKSAIAGFVLGIFAYLIILVLEICEPRTGELWKSLLPLGTGFDRRHGASVLSIFLGFIIPFAINPFYGREKAERRSANERGDLIELLIAESLDRSKPIELSLRNGKSYVGFALRSGMTRHGESDVALIPTASGYRDKDSQELKITNNYERVILKYFELDPENSDVLVEDFRIVIPMSEIVSARIFLPEAYRLFQRATRRPVDRVVVRDAGEEAPYPGPLAL